MSTDVRYLLAALLLGICSSIHAGDARETCLIKSVALNGEPVRDCAINNGIEHQRDLHAFCSDFAEVRKSLQHDPAPQIVYMTVCPEHEQAQCHRPDKRPVQVLYYGRSQAQLAEEQQWCELLGGRWASSTEESNGNATHSESASERWDLCRHLDGKSFVSLQRFKMGLSLFAQHWKLEFDKGKIVWRKTGGETELLSYRCDTPGQAAVTSLESGETFTLEGSIYSLSIIFEGVAYEQLTTQRTFQSEN